MGISRKKALPTIAGFFIVFIAIAWQRTDIPLAQDIRQRIEAVIFDIRMNLELNLKHTQDIDERIIIVTVDEKSLNEQGHWPWPRNRIAELVDNIFSGGAAVVGFDILFPEAQLNSVDQVVTAIPTDQSQLRLALQEIRPTFDHDLTLAKSFENGDVVLAYAFHDKASPSPYPLPASRVIRESTNFVQLEELPFYNTNIPVLQDSAMGAGFVNPTPDNDGILRRTPMVMSHQGHIYSSLSLEMARLFYLHENVTLNTTKISQQTTAESISVGKIRIPIDNLGKAIIPYKGKSPSFQYLSATDILNGRIDPSRFEGKLVIIGATALGLFDFIATPVQSIYPGVEVHANLLSAILNESFPNLPAWADGANFSLILITGVILACLLPWLGPMPLLIISCLVSALAIYVNFWWWQHGWVIELAPLLTMIILLAFLNLTFGYITENRQRNFLKNTFGQYIPPALVEQMLNTEDTISMEGDSRELSVLFADIRSFTTISESMTPTDLKKMLNHFFTHMTRDIFDHHGTIDKYVGDMIMAFWGAPLTDDNHAQHAVEAAFAMLNTVEKLKPEFKRLGYPDVNIGIGINTGIMNVGDMGSTYRRAYTVLGDAVNLASRIEGLTKYYGAELVIGEDTYHKIDGIVCRKLDRVKVKGKQTAVEVYEPLCMTQDADKQLLEEVNNYHHALSLYWQQQWTDSQSTFSQLLNNNPSSVLYQLYLDRINEVSKLNLPTTWDGVYERTSK